MKNIKIAPIIIACGTRYNKLARIAIRSFLQYHEHPIFVITDNMRFLGKVTKINIKQYQDKINKFTKQYNFAQFEYDKENHNRIYSALKPLIMSWAIEDYYPEATHILSLDADTIFSGEILSLIPIKPKYDLYMVQRTDDRMLLMAGRLPGSGFTLWKRDSEFITQYENRFNRRYTGVTGGSQTLIIKLRDKLETKMIENPYLHFVSPDTKNPNLTDKEIATWKPAYIHLHGNNSLERLQRFKKVFDKLNRT